MSHTKCSAIIAQLPNYFYPFLNSTQKSRPFEYLRLTSLGVIGALVKSDSPEVIEYLLKTEIIPLCLRIMESGNELSRTVRLYQSDFSNLYIGCNLCYSENFA